MTEDFTVCSLHAVILHLFISSWPGIKNFEMGQKLHQLTDFWITMHRTQVYTANIYRPDVSYKVKYNFLASDILYLGPAFLKALQVCLGIILILVPMMLL